MKAASVVAVCIFLFVAKSSLGCPPVSLEPVQVQSLGVQQFGHVQQFSTVQVFAQPQFVTSFAVPVVAQQVVFARSRGCASGVCQQNVIRVQSAGRVSSRSVTRTRVRSR